ncbi:MAG: tetratricopeptide repeat protein, partial [Saprospiraceae bacterium]|nr:tetratricopeptide repeat protein [Saprospiraceae bacterium]
MTNIPPPILEAIRNNRLILWVGAGFSQRRLGLPAWRGLVHELLDTCLPPDDASGIKTRLDAGQLTEVQALESIHDHAEKCFPVLFDQFHLSLDRADERLQDFHLLWNISHKIVTTNYDTGLDLTRPGSVPKVVYDKKYQLKKLVAGQKFYFKLHGCASEPENCILFEQQYQDLYRDTSADKLDVLSDEDTPAKFLLKNLLTDHVVLFVGFGIEERIDFVLEYIHRLLGDTATAKYTLTHRNNTDNWPHTEKWTVDDWDQLPEFLQLLAEEKAKHTVPVVRGDTVMPFDRAYVGREADVHAVENFFRSSDNFFFLSGAGGMGKSHLLDTVLRRLPAEQQPVYFRIERHYTLLTITQKLGIEPVPPAPANQPNRHLLKALERVNRPLVFDDFYEISDPALYYTLLELPKQTNIKSLIISRSLDRNWARFDSGVYHRELRELERPDFDTCMRAMAEKMPAYADKPPTPQQLDICWELGGGYPLGGLLLLGLLTEPDFDPGHIEKLDLAGDPSRSHFVNRLLDAILKKGSEAERNLAREIAVFAEPVPEAAFAGLPAWNPDRIAFYSLWHRKGLIFRRQDDQYFGMHALVRSLILKQLGDAPEARACAGRYYESLTSQLEVEQVVALQKAWEHYNLSTDAERDAFSRRMEGIYTGVNVVQLRDEQDSALAIERFSFRLQLNPDDASAANELGMAYRRQGNYDKAIEVLQKAADAQPDNVIVLNELGITLREAGQRDKAIEVLQKATAAQPDNVIVLNELGITLRESRQRDKAIEVLQKAADLGNMHAMNELGITLRETGQRDKAIEVLQ